MAKAKQRLAVEGHFKAGPDVGKRVGFNVSPEIQDKFTEMAEFYGVKNKDLFVAMVLVTYEEFLEVEGT